MSSNDVKMQSELVLTKIRRLKETLTLSGWMVVDSNEIGTKKFNVANLALKSDITDVMGEISTDREPLECDYRMVYPYHTGLCGNMTKWGSRDNAFGKFNHVLAAVDWVV